jgi:Na+/serine symporter
MNFWALIILSVTFLVFIGLGLAVKFWVNKIKDGLKIKVCRRLSHLFITMGIVGLVYLFFAWQGVALLSSRFWLIIWLACTVVWAGFIVKYLFLEAPKIRREIEEKRKFEKYLP